MNNPKRPTGQNLNWNQIFYFSEVAGCGSFKEAAERLGLSASTLSEHVAQLEKDLNVTLFHRQHRKISLTAEGSRFYIHAKEMFEVGKRLTDVLSPHPLGGYPIAVGLVPNASIHVAYELLGDFLQHPGALNFRVFHSKHAELEMSLAKARFDFGFSDQASDRKDLTSVLVSSSFVKFYVSSQWWKSSFSELINQLPLLICVGDPTKRSQAEQLLRDANLLPTAVGTSEYPGVLLSLCQRGLGIGVFSEDPISRMNLRALKPLRAPANAPKLKQELYALWSKDAENTEAIKRLKALLKSNPRRA